MMRNDPWLQSATAMYYDMQAPSLTSTTWTGDAHYHNTYVTKIEPISDEGKRTLASSERLIHVGKELIVKVAFPLLAFLVGGFALGWW